jgi:hypothetical protein
MDDDTPRKNAGRKPITVFAAMGGNLFIAAVKFVAAAFTGSSRPPRSSHSSKERTQRIQA